MRENAKLFEQTVTAFRGFYRIIRHKPDVLILGTSTKIVSFYTLLRRFGFLRSIKIITDKQFLKEREVRYLDKIIIYSPEEKNFYPEELRSKFVFIHYPAKSQLVEIPEVGKKDYIFAGGNHKRDFKTLIKAVEGLPSKVLIVTKNKLSGEIPKNVEVRGPVPLEEYLSLMKNAMFIVVPLLKSDVPHGHCDISNALSLGKPVITTRGASVEAYIEEGKNGLLVEASSVSQYREAVSILMGDKEKLGKLSQYTKEHANNFSYEEFGKKLLELCQ